MTTIGPMGLGGIDALYTELAEMQDTQRKAARDARHEAQASQMTALRAQAEHTKDAAVLQGIGQIAQGVGTAGAGALNLTAGSSQQSQQHAQGWAGLASGGGAVGAGVASISAASEQADAQRCTARATAAAARADDAKDVEEDAERSRETLLRRLEAAKGIQSELRSSLLRA